MPQAEGGREELDPVAQLVFVSEASIPLSGLGDVPSDVLPGPMSHVLDPVFHGLGILLACLLSLLRIFEEKVKAGVAIVSEKEGIGCHTCYPTDRGAMDE